jgi:hypothetical protein
LRSCFEQCSGVERSTGPVRFQGDAFISRLHFGKRDEVRIRDLMLKNLLRAHALYMEHIHFRNLSERLLSLLGIAR